MTSKISPNILCWVLKALFHIYLIKLLYFLKVYKNLCHSFNDAFTFTFTSLSPVCVYIKREWSQFMISTNLYKTNIDKNVCNREPLLECVKVFVNLQWQPRLLRCDTEPIDHPIFTALICSVLQTGRDRNITTPHYPQHRYVVHSPCFPWIIKRR